MAELDELLSTTLKRIAPPADPSGVADAIRARVEAGDLGVSATSSTAPGWGGGGAAGWLPWIGLVVVAGLVGGGIGVSGVAGAATDEVAVVGHTSVLDATVGAQLCPGGPVVRTMTAGTRALLVERSEDSGYLGLRDPGDFSRTVWLPASVVAVDEGQDVGALPVGEACPVVTVEAIQPVVVPVAPTPEQPKPGAPKDATAPSITGIGASPTVIINAESTTITVTATDNVGVAGVQLSWTGGVSGSTNMTRSGSSWVFTFSSNSPTPNDLTFTARAVDAAGNLSSPASVVVDWQYFG